MDGPAEGEMSFRGSVEPAAKGSWACVGKAVESFQQFTWQTSTQDLGERLPSRALRRV